LEPLLVEYYGNGGTLPVSEPVPTITTKDRFALLEPSSKYGLDIRFRMLKNHELKKAQGFPDDYQITGNATEQTKQIGNAVPVNTAKALAKAAMGA
jgi:DNA (cytosine-5)-methyltransferase 1